MAMSPRILLFTAIGISLYLGLSLYHGHQLKKNPDLKPGAGKDEEKTWVQVSTTKQVTSGQVQPLAGQRQPEGGAAGAAAGSPDGPEHPSPVREQQQNVDPATTTDDPRLLLSALQAELQQSRTLLQNREEELRQARLLLERARAEQQRAIDNTRKLREELPPARNEEDQQLAASDRLQAELSEAKARAAIAEGELERARLKAESMFRYGQEQSRLLAPARLEAETLRTRLQETKDKLRQAEQQVTSLNNREQMPRKERDALRDAKAHDAPAGGTGEPTAAVERAD